MDSYAIYLLARMLIAFFGRLPRGMAAAAIRMLAALFYRLAARYRHIADINLRIAFPELSRAERSALARRSFQNVALNLLEVGRLPRLSPDTVGALVEYDSDQDLQNYRAAQAHGKGILYLTGHFSAWELLPAAHALNGHPLHYITRPLDNERLDRHLNRIREAHGNRAISKKNSARAALRHLKAGGAFGILMDQNTSLQEGIFVDFFGIPAATSTGMALLALRTDAPVLPGYLTPMRGGRYRIRFLPPMLAERTGNMQHDLRINTQRYNDILERIVREQPESWLWGHRRWKNQPEGNPLDLYSLSAAERDAFLLRMRHKKD